MYPKRQNYPQLRNSLIPTTVIACLACYSSLFTRLPVSALASFSFPSYFTMHLEVSFLKIQIFSYYLTKTLQWLPWVLRDDVWNCPVAREAHAYLSATSLIALTLYAPVIPNFSQYQMCHTCFSPPKLWALTSLFFLPIAFFFPHSPQYLFIF